MRRSESAATLSAGFRRSGFGMVVRLFVAGTSLVLRQAQDDGGGELRQRSCGDKCVPKRSLGTRELLRRAVSLGTKEKDLLSPAATRTTSSPGHRMVRRSEIGLRPIRSSEGISLALARGNCRYIRRCFGRSGIGTVERLFMAGTSLVLRQAQDDGGGRTEATELRGQVRSQTEFGNEGTPAEGGEFGNEGKGPPVACGDPDNK